jgi:hypothetical protein
VSAEKTSGSVLPLNWVEVLDGVAQALAKAEAEAARASASPQADSPSPTPETGLLLSERLRQLNECVARAEQSAEQAESCLQASEALFRRWITEAKAVRERLETAAASRA